MNPTGRGDRRPEPPADPSESQHKVLIPRLPRPDRPPKQPSKPKDRVQRACRSCHRRKIKCSGGVPRCDYCEKSNRKCVYDSTRRDRLATVTTLNDRLVSLLRDLGGRVNAVDKSLIEVALQDSEDEESSPVPSQSIDAAELASPTTSSILPPSLLLEASSITRKLDESASFRSPGKGLALESLAHNTKQHVGYEGFAHSASISDANWMLNLEHRVRRLQPTPAVLSTSTHDANYYLDDQGIQLHDPGNPFSLPDEASTRILFQCYLGTVEKAFPLVPPGLDHEIFLYYHSLRHQQSVNLPQTWYAMVNLALAIGARFSRLVNADWQKNQFDEQIYLSRAYQLLGFNETAIVLSKPDVTLTQSTGLLAFYYMASGHIDRAWLMIGTAIRFAITLGLHKNDDHTSIGTPQKRASSQIWWSLHNLESLLCTLTGRPCMLHDEDITVPLPSDFAKERVEQESDDAPAMSFQDAQVRLANSSRQILSKLYSERREAQTRTTTESRMTSLMSELDAWALEALPRHLQAADTPPELDRLQLMLRKHYCRQKILITRPSLLRIEKSYVTHPENITAFDRTAAEICIQTAQEVVGLLPDRIDLRGMYERGPWWTIVHNFMQCSAILLISISLRTIFPLLLDPSISSFRKVILWLHAMRDANDMADRAYRLTYRVVVSAKEDTWPEILDCFPEHMLDQEESEFVGLDGININVPGEPVEMFMAWSGS